MITVESCQHSYYTKNEDRRCTCTCSREDGKVSTNLLSITGWNISNIKSCEWRWWYQWYMNLYWILALLHSRKIIVFDKKYSTYSIISRIKLLIQLTKIIPMQRYNIYDHAYKMSKFGKFDLFARTIIRAVLKFAHLGVREK